MQKVYAKIFAVQSKIDPITKSETNPFFNSRYFDINKIITVLRPLLIEAKLAVMQPLTQVNGKPAIKLIICDIESGETVEDTTVLTEINDAQKMGSAITYFRRYQLVSCFMLEADDDDGNHASGKSSKPDVAPRKVEPKAPVKEPTLAEIAAAFNEEPFASDERQTAVKQSVAMQGGKIDGDPCADCMGGVYVTSKTTGKVFCNKKCWLNK